MSRKEDLQQRKADAERLIAQGVVLDEYQAFLPEAKEDEELAFHYFMRDTILEFKKLRKQKGITQEVLATRMGTKQTAVSRFESYSGEPSLKFLHKYAKALGVSLNALSCAGEFNLNIPTELYALAIQVYGNDSESVKSNILETISIEVKSRHEYKNEILQAFSSTGLYSSEDWSNDVVITGGTS